MKLFRISNVVFLSLFLAQVIHAQGNQSVTVNCKNGTKYTFTDFGRESKSEIHKKGDLVRYISVKTQTNLGMFNTNFNFKYIKSIKYSSAASKDAKDYLPAKISFTDGKVQDVLIARTDYIGKLKDQNKTLSDSEIDEIVFR